MRTMQTCDCLGRILLPAEIRARFLVSANTSFLVTLDCSGQKMVLRPTQEVKQIFQSGAEIRKRQGVMAKQPPQRWRFIRSVDEIGRVVLPRRMRDYLGWTAQTTIDISADADYIYVSGKA